MQDTDFTNELENAFRQYCETKTTPPVSSKAMGYVRHCLQKASMRAAMLGEEVSIEHHQFFVFLALEIGHPELIADFLMSLADTAEPDKAAEAREGV